MKYGSFPFEQKLNQLHYKTHVYDTALRVSETKAVCYVLDKHCPPMLDRRNYPIIVSDLLKYHLNSNKSHTSNL